MFLAQSAFWANQLGIKFVYDSERHLGAAKIIFDEWTYDTFNFWYSGYTIWLKIFQISTSSDHALILSQIILSLAGLLALYFTSLSIYQNRSSAFVTCLLMMLYVDTYSWNFYILAESIYLSFICLTLWSIARKRDFNRIEEGDVLILILVIFTFLVKPTGIVLLGSTLFLFLWFQLNQVEIGFIKVLIPIALLAGTLTLGNFMLKGFNVVSADYMTGNVIHSIDQFPKVTGYHFLHVKNSDVAAPESGEPVMALLEFIIQQPGYCFELFLKKVGLFLLNVRPYWSWGHITFNLGLIFIIYLGVVMNSRHEKRTFLRVFFFVYLIGHVVVVGLTRLDWDGRFFIVMMPVLCLMAGNGLVLVFMKYGKPMMKSLPTK